MRLPRHCDGLVAVRGFAHDVDVVLGVEEGAEAGPHERLVVGEHDADHARSPTGIHARTRKPPDGRAAASSRPPSAATRSRIPSSPVPLPVVPLHAVPLGGVPVPSSSTCTTIASGEYDRLTTVAAEPAWRTTLVSASCTTRYAATSTGWGSRPADALHVDHHVEPGGGGALDQLVDVVERGRRRSAAQRRPGPQDVEDRAQLFERVLARVLDRAQRVSGLLRLLVPGGARRWPAR